jgi:hypothetical protein
MSNPTKKYLVGGVLVEAVKSEGGGFYELTVVDTGDKQRYLADVFEVVAIPMGFCDILDIPHKKDLSRLKCKNWRHV